MLTALAVVAALVLLGIAMQDAFEVMLLPRRVDRRMRLARIYFRGAWSGWAALARLLPPGQRQVRLLGVFGPLAMMVLFALWAAMLIAGFGLLEWTLQGRHRPVSGFADQLYMSGATFFTLGYGDVVPHSGAARALVVVESGTGLGFIAVVIGYLPVLYQMFARREAHVIQLDVRAGSPPTASNMLILHAELNGLAKLDDLLMEWEVWGAELLESHLSYPMLVFYRSQHDNQSWLAAMTAVMDSCALILVGVDDLKPLQARMTFTMTRSVVVEMCRALSVKPSPYSGGDRLPHEDYRRMEAAFAAAGIGWQGGDDAEEVLHALRATYEPLLDGLATRLLLPLPPWLPADDQIDHWEGGHRGLIASRLVAQLARPGPSPVLTGPSGGRDRLGRRLRQLLKPDETPRPGAARPPSRT